VAALTVLDERGKSVKLSKFSEEQFVYTLRQTESDTPSGDLCWQYAIEEQTFYTCPPKYAYFFVSEPRRLRQLEEENSC
jgi:putative transposase